MTMFSMVVAVTVMIVFLMVVMVMVVVTMMVIMFAVMMVRFFSKHQEPPPKWERESGEAWGRGSV
jgi:heme/copper-type cytochrome/quinol oxidase subunit 2